ncbi:MAG: DNA helicase RecQ [Bacteroidetes bacterium]|nr:DNA helicase RecQ [Bacteroidota bacterium]
MLAVQEKSIKKTLKEVFGYDQFRGQQEAVINNLLAGRDSFVIMPTGAGKSLCYQLPAIIQKGTAIIISPLIALMKNQVDQLVTLGVNARFLNSTLSKAEMNRVKKDTLEGHTKLLYVAPESLTKEDNVTFLKKADISFVAVDEAHCISEWGHDFRPEYRRIKDILSQLDNELPIIALTATATPKVQLDILKNLDMYHADAFKLSFYRKNLYYEVRPKQNAKKNLIKYIKEHKHKSGIIYCLSRKKVEEIANLLNVNDIKAAPYHAGLEAAVRIKNQDDFLNEEVDVIVATIAFGMGIDKPDVRFVIHYDVPKSLEGYYQETGRAGRDGLEGNCIMFYSHNDILKLEKFHKDKSVTERENARVLLNEMASYAESSVCRVRQLLHYFGESFEKDCGFCDNCVRPKEKFEGKEFVELVIRTAVQTGERFGMAHLVNVIRGSENQYVKSYVHDKLDVFGKGSEETEEFWNSVLRQSLLLEFLEKDIDYIGVLKVTEKGDSFIREPFDIQLTKDHDFSDLGEEEESEKEVLVGKAYDETLFEMLKKLRKQIAREKGLPPYVIFQDPSLEEMATTYPTTIQELEEVIGVGKGKAAKFGEEFVSTIELYVDENDIITVTDVRIKSAVNKSRNKVFIIQQIDKMMDLEEIADAKNLTMDDLLEEIESIISSGTKLNLNYYIDQVIDEDRQEDLYEYFLNVETDSIKVALEDEDNMDYTEEEIRLIRIKFLCEYAH